MVNLRSKSSSPCRISTRLRSDSPIRKALTIRTKMKIVDQFKAASSISIVAEENNLAYSVVKRAVTKKQLEFIQGDRFRDYGGGAKLAYSGHSKDRFTVCVDIGADGSMNKALILLARKTSWNK